MADTTNKTGSQGGSTGKHGAMTPEEAGHLGGAAPHRCRGFACEKEGESSSRKQRGSSESHSDGQE